MLPICYLALGDSYTISETVEEAEYWSHQLGKLLNEHGLKTDVTIIARTGQTTDELWQGIQEREIDLPYELVSVLIGVNNQYRGRDIEEYREQFTCLLVKAIEFTGGDADWVIVISIPAWGASPFAYGRNTTEIAKGIDLFNTVNREETEKAGAYFVDITPISWQAVRGPSLIAADGLHPSGKMYAMWTEKALPIARDILLVEKGE